MKKNAADRNYRMFGKKVNLVPKIAIAAPYEESEADPEIWDIVLDEGEDGIVTLQEDNAAIVSKSLDKVGEILGEIIDQLTATTVTSVGYSMLHKDTYDPRLVSLIDNLEEANEKLFNAGMQANHLRDGTGG